MCSNQLFSQTNSFKLEKTTTFFKGEENINEDNIEWDYLIVPENWDNPNGKTIKIAIAILKRRSNKTDKNAVIYLEGGPGAGGINRIWSWLDHPLRNNNDIILIDVRGTGFSFPKFCPDLGKEFLEILAKNQNSTQDEQQKMIAAMACKDDLLKRNIDINSYNSKSIARDLNALKKVLKYKSWNVYGISYGTYVAQIYANDFPEDIKSLILDSSISDISEYYNKNTTNYVASLERVFEDCKSDPNCNKQYPNLERTYYNIIKKLDKNPITVDVDKKIIANGYFSYNSEDFKIAIQQSLYRKRLIELLPLLITEFDKNNKKTLSSLVSAFSGALGLDYGQYYCMSCDEAVPNNSISQFQKDASKYKQLNGGLSFYKSDFVVCDNWNSGNNVNRKAKNDLSRLSEIKAPVLVFSGIFDPITPVLNGVTTVKKFKNGILVNAPVYGHTPSFSEEGFDIVAEFINNPSHKLSITTLQSDNKVNFITDIVISSGISSLSDSLGQFNLLFFVPFFIAIIILFITVFNFTYLLIRKRESNIENKIMKYIIIINVILGLFVVIGLAFAIDNTARTNFYILAFGIPNQFSYLFAVQWVYVVLTFITTFYFIFKMKFLYSRSIIVTIIFSLFVLITYFQYWGFLL
jgi:pimeloyl-ACP methyl ester carboxylesterase